ncbi:MAG TPA: sugar phosphate nucleotidyltransferase [Candidatus Nitrosotenuis sp.]|nr:sugar phosphate nucleotidyltransferase [Candidatus Nitrosotenuis sp.]
MAGGEGTRLRPLTCNRPKPLVPICNKPVMEYILELLRRHGLETVLVTLHYLADEVVSYFGDGSDWGLQIIYSVEDEPLGTAGSIKRIEEYLDETFLVISGDSFTDIDLGRLLAFHKERGSTATVTLTRVENPLEYGVVICDEERRIQKFLEKPSWGEVFSDTVNTGMYVLEPEIFAYLEPDRPADFSLDLFPTLLKKGRPLYGYVAEGYWCDIGSLQEYRAAHDDLFAGRVLHEIPGEQIGRGLWVGSGTEIHPTARLIAPVVVGRNCRIGADAVVGENTVVGDNCIIEEGATVHRSILWHNVYLGKKVRASGASVCRNCTIKSYAQLGEGAVLGDRVFVGEGAVIHPGVKIWPDKNIEGGATVSMSLIWGMKWPGSLFGVDGISGLANIEITPDFALRLGAAYGAFLERGDWVTTSRDSHPASRIINRALICGLTSVGVNVLDLRMTPAPISRYLIKNGPPVGGIHCRLSPEDPRLLQIQFYDSRGINCSRASERKIENLFIREDFRRTPMDDVGVIDFPARTIEQYSEGFTSRLDIELIRQARFKVVIDYSCGNAAQVLPSLLGKLGTETVSLNAYLDFRRAREIQKAHEQALQQLAALVTTLKAHLGVMLDADAERLWVVDETGRILAGNALLAILCLMVFKQVPEALVAVPMSAPGVLEDLAARYGGRIIRTRTDSRSLMHIAALGEARIAFAGTPQGAFIFSQFSPAFDAMFAFARLLEMMARERSPLSALAERIPPFHMVYQEVECSWQDKGRIMRLLVEEFRDQPLEMLDGVKIYWPDGWALVIPHPSRASLLVWSEGPDDERAREIVELLRQRVGQLTRRREEPRSRVRVRGPISEQEVLPHERAFHFWTPGRYLGVQARSLREFIDIVHYIEAGSLEFHLQRGDFVNWLDFELHHPALAAEVRCLQEQGLTGEALRRSLLDILERNRSQVLHPG